jgi:chromosome segregation ATPase
MLKQQSALTASHQQENREVMKQVRDEVQKVREQMQAVQSQRLQWDKQKMQLEDQVNFVKTNSAATIERLTRYREQAQEKIEKLEQRIRELQP